MSAAPSSCQGSYDVFLNFRGKDTRNGFTAHLYEGLCSKEILTFMDADKIVKGEEISPALITAMDKSMFCIVVLSKNYASSTWCLEELVRILECKKAKKQTVLPIFYDVNPSDVREQKGSFAKAFAELEEKFKEEKERVQMWKQALTEVANISGWDARNKHEPTLIKEIIQYISDALIDRSSKDAEAIARVDSHLQAKERIPVPNVPSLANTGERSELPLRSKRKMNLVIETDVRKSRDAMEAYSEPDVYTSSTVGKRSEIPLTSKRKIDQTKETEITHAPNSSSLHPLFPSLTPHALRDFPDPFAGLSFPPKLPAAIPFPSNSTVTSGGIPSPSLFLSSLPSPPPIISPPTSPTTFYSPRPMSLSWLPSPSSILNLPSPNFNWI